MNRIWHVGQYYYKNKLTTRYLRVNTSIITVDHANTILGNVKIKAIKIQNPRRFYFNDIQFESNQRGEKIVVFSFKIEKVFYVHLS